MPQPVGQSERSCGFWIITAEIIPWIRIIADDGTVMQSNSSGLMALRYLLTYMIYFQARSYKVVCSIIYYELLWKPSKYAIDRVYLSED